MKEEKQLFYAASNQIVLNPLNTWENGDMDGMVASIRSFGILEPLTVMGPFEDGNYMLLAGERRLKSIWRYNVPYKVDTSRRRDCLKC